MIVTSPEGPKTCERRVDPFLYQGTGGSIMLNYSIYKFLKENQSFDDEDKFDRYLRDAQESLETNLNLIE